MSSENPIGADNQQETEDPHQRLDPWWIVGFVDGEGCFSVSIHRNEANARRTGGWQLTPVFQVSQHESNRTVLKRIAAHFGCGNLYGKGPNSSVMTFTVSRLSDLADTVIPFFEQHPLRVKGRDFRTFAEIVRSMRRREHWSPEGFDRLVRSAYSMNAHGKQRSRAIEDILQGSSETVRQASR